MKKWTLLALILLVTSMMLMVACSSDDDDDTTDGDNTEDGDDSPDGDDNTPDGDDSPDGDETPDGDDETPDGDDTGANPVGGACEDDDGCEEGLDCLTSEYANTAFSRDDLVVENGYCSLPLCTAYTVADGHKDLVCDADSGGLCISLFPFMGESYAAMGICLKLCDSDADCRTEDDNSCLDPADWVTDGLLDQAVYDTYFTGVKACAPASLITAAEEGMAGE